MSISLQDLPEMRSLLLLQKNLADGKFKQGQVLGMSLNRVTGPWIEGIVQCSGYAEEFQQTRAMEPYFKNMMCLGMATCPEAMQAWIGCLQDSAKHSESGGPEASQCQRLRKTLERCTRSHGQQLLRSSAVELFKK